jgi:ubiquinone/menaquinone biosynthesis C-methylase UbiE
MSTSQRRPPVEDVTLFTTVDRTQDPGFFARFLDAGNALASIQASKPLILDALDLRPGQVAIDVGCGTGADVIEMAGRVGPRGRVVGVDVSQSLIAEAQQRWVDSDLPVEFRVCDAQELDLDDASVDACRTERVLMHVPDEQRAISEMVRVTRRGGRVAAFDFDWDTFIIDSPMKETTRTVARSFSDGIRHGWIGRQMPRLFREHGLTDVTVVPHQVFVHVEFLELLLGGHLVRTQTEGLIKPDEVERWWTNLREAAEQGQFLATFTAFIVAGTVP